MKKVVYTAIFGDKDSLKNLPNNEDYDNVIFTDNSELTSDEYKVIVCPPKFSDPTRNARYYKVNSHVVLPNYDCSLWIDANIEVKEVDINQLFEEYLNNHDIALHAHPERNCIYDEADICKQINKDNPEVINQQMKKYHNLEYPKGNGLISSSIMFRKHTAKIAELNKAWWQEILNHSRRDQLSYNYVADKNNVANFTIAGHVRKKNVKGFTIFGHNHEDFINW